jgi:hypothetical protein
MTTSALTMMILTMGTVITFTVYFFYRALKTQHKEGSDSYGDKK